MSAAELARQLHVPSNRIYQLISGKRAMTADTALRLEQWLGVEAAFWMNLQNSYELDLATEKSGEKIKKTVLRRSAPSVIQAVAPKLLVADVMEKREALRADIQQGINSGPGRPVPEVTADLQACYQQWAEQGAPADAL